MHSVSAPFTITMWRPKVPQTLPMPNVSTGLLPKVPYNKYTQITRKGVLPLAGQSYKNLVITTTVEAPAGCDTADPANVRAALSAHFGALVQQSAGVGDTVINGVL